MRKGSTPGSLGTMCAKLALLILPFSALFSTYGPGVPVVRAESEKAAEGNAEEARHREALLKRLQWLGYRPGEKPASTQQPQKPKAAAVKPVKVINTRATWYGPGFHGRRTASGEIFNRHRLTLASRHLPFGTKVRVINPKTGKSAVGHVNDRGPFVRGYTVDLSEALARKVGMLSSGAIRLEILPKK